MRQISTFQERGWDVSVVGFSGKLPVPESWDFHEISPPPPSTTDSAKQSAREPLVMLPARGQLWYLLRRIGGPIYRRTLKPVLRVVRGTPREVRPETPPSTDNPAAKLSIAQRLFMLDAPRELSIQEASEVYFLAPVNKHFREAIADKLPHCNLIVAHDYQTMPMAGMLAKRMGTRYVLDIHEYAMEQFLFEKGSTQEKYFNNVTRPLISALHHYYFPTAHGITSACNGISKQLQIDYELPSRPHVVRSTPRYSKMPYRPAAETIEVMYHGLIDPSRHLEVGVKSLALWRPEFRLTIRGPGPQAYLDSLAALARELGVEDRLSIVPPVPFPELVSTANQADIGYLAFLNFSRQRQFASPNKFFEYIMAGLAIVVMDVPELAPVVRENGIGRLIGAFEPEAIAEVVNGFDRESINAAKRASLKLAKTLNWEHEQMRMVEAYGLVELEKSGARDGPNALSQTRAIT